MPTNKPLTDAQMEEVIELLVKHGSYAAAARATGIPESTLKSRANIARTMLVRKDKETKPADSVPLAQPKCLPLADLPFIKGRKHMVIPDVQAKPGVPLDHLRWAGDYAVVKKPDVIVIIGDWWDMASLCSYDRGKRSYEGRRYKLDIAAGNKALDLFMAPIVHEMKRDRKWKPEMHFVEGNHEYRIKRAVEDQPELDGVIGPDDFNLSQYGFKYHDFKEVVKIDGVHYSHYFVSGEMGRPVTSARALITKKHCSCVMGHVQRFEIATDRNADGELITGLFVGAYYQHDEGYLDPQINRATWRGIHCLYGVSDGHFTSNAVDLPYLRERFKKK